MHDDRILSYTVTIYQRLHQLCLCANRYAASPVIEPANGNSPLRSILFVTDSVSL